MSRCVKPPLARRTCRLRDEAGRGGALQHRNGYRSQHTYQIGKGSPLYRLESFSIVFMKLPTATHTNWNLNVIASPRNRLRTTMRCVVNLHFPRLRLVVPALTSLCTRAHGSSSTLAPVLSRNLPAEPTNQVSQRSRVASLLS
jgi:hypothetical protein